MESFNRNWKNTAPVWAAVALFLNAVPATSRNRRYLRSTPRPEVSKGQAMYVQRMPSTEVLRLNLALPLRNQSELDNLLSQLYDPQSPSFHHFLNVAEFTSRFGPTQQDHDAVLRFAQASGLSVTNTSANRMVIDVQGTVAQIEKAFHVDMGIYQHPTENRTFYSPDREPSANLSTPLWHITGLDNFSLPRPASVHGDPNAVAHTTGSGPNGQFIGSDFRAAYYGGTALTGSGQSVGLLEFAGYNT